MRAGPGAEAAAPTASRHPSTAPDRAAHPSGCTVRAMTGSSTKPITITLVDDYDVVLTGLAHLFDAHRDRVIVSEIDANSDLSDTIDVVLYDSFAQPESDHEQVAALVADPRKIGRAHV